MREDPWTVKGKWRSIFVFVNRIEKVLRYTICRVISKQRNRGNKTSTKITVTLETKGVWCCVGGHWIGEIPNPKSFPRIQSPRPDKPPLGSLSKRERAPHKWLQQTHANRHNQLGCKREKRLVLEVFPIIFVQQASVKNSINSFGPTDRSNSWLIKDQRIESNRKVNRVFQSEFC